MPASAEYGRYGVHSAAVRTEADFEFVGLFLAYGLCDLHALYGNGIIDYALRFVGVDMATNPASRASW